MRIAVASGKGGTGKTTVTLSMAEYFARRSISVAVLDCDVEEPNVNLFLKAGIDKKIRVSVPVPSVNFELCSSCGRCGEVCRFSSMVMIKGRPLFLKEMCHSCGGCMLVCPEGAITEVPRGIGDIEIGSSGNIGYAGGRLDIGEAISPPLIKEVKNYYPRSEVVLLDSPPGTSCPVIESVKGSDFLILVSEPTPFGLNDLNLAVEMATALKIQFGVVENRASDGNEMLKAFCERESIDLIASIPDTRDIAVRYSQGEFSSYINDNFSSELERIAGYINKRVKAAAL